MVLTPTKQFTESQEVYTCKASGHRRCNDVDAIAYHCIPGGILQNALCNYSQLGACKHPFPYCTPGACPWLILKAIAAE